MRPTGNPLAPRTHSRHSTGIPEEGSMKSMYFCPLYTSAAVLIVTSLFPIESVSMDISPDSPDDSLCAHPFDKLFFCLLAIVHPFSPVEFCNNLVRAGGHGGVGNHAGNGRSGKPLRRGCAH